MRILRRAAYLIAVSILLAPYGWCAETLTEFSADQVTVLNEELRSLDIGNQIKEDGGLDLYSGEIENVATPTQAYSAATKQYVDDQVGTGNKIVQVKNYQRGTLATGTTTIPLDDTIPQNSEGDEYMTLAITPSSASNYLKIDVVVFGSSSGVTGIIVAALFQDSTAGALSAGCMGIGNNGYPVELKFTYYMTAGTTSETTFKVRAGNTTTDGGTFTLNGVAGARLFGGVEFSSITITEIKA